MKNHTNRHTPRKTKRVRVYQSDWATRAVKLHAGQGRGALLEDSNIIKNAGRISHDNARGEALHVVRQIRRGAAVAAIPRRIAAVLLVFGTPRIKFDEALRLTAEGAEDGDDSKLDGVVLDPNGIVVHAGVRCDVADARGMIKGWVTSSATLRATEINDAKVLFSIAVCKQVTDICGRASHHERCRRQHGE